MPYGAAWERGIPPASVINTIWAIWRGTRATPAPMAVCDCVYGAAIGVCGIERINRTRMTRMTRIIADKTQKDQRQSALSASSAFYQPAH